MVNNRGWTKGKFKEKQKKEHIKNHIKYRKRENIKSSNNQKKDKEGGNNKLEKRGKMNKDLIKWLTKKTNNLENWPRNKKIHWK